MAKLILEGDVALLQTIQSLWKSRLKSTQLTNEVIQEVPSTSPQTEEKVGKEPDEEEELEEEQEEPGDITEENNMSSEVLKAPKAKAKGKKKR